eukprot:2842061-Alexandrium_andersonii.AAC.1
MDHTLRSAVDSGFNPSNSWTFAEEDIIGRIARVAGQAHKKTLSSRTLERWLLFYMNELQR